MSLQDIQNAPNELVIAELRRLVAVGRADDYPTAKTAFAHGGLDLDRVHREAARLAAAIDDELMDRDIDDLVFLRNAEKARAARDQAQEYLRRLANLVRIARRRGDENAEVVHAAIVEARDANSTPQATYFDLHRVLRSLKRLPVAPDLVHPAVLSAGHAVLFALLERPTERDTMLTNRTNATEALDALVAEAKALFTEIEEAHEVAKDHRPERRPVAGYTLQLLSSTRPDREIEEDTIDTLLPVGIVGEEAE